MKTYYLHTLNGDVAILCGRNFGRAYLATHFRRIDLRKDGYPTLRDLRRDQTKLINCQPSFFDGQRLGYVMVRA